MNVLDLVRERWGVNIKARSPIEVPNVSRENEFPLLMRDAGFKIGVEVGVEQGLYSERLCQLIPGLKLYSVDSWTAYRGYRTHVSQEKLDGFYSATRTRVAPFDCQVIRKFSVDAAQMFDDRSIDFVYIDANHDLANVIKDIDAWAPKVRKGGIVSGHDFKLLKNKSSMQHVVQAVRAWTECYDISPWFVLGRKSKRQGEVRDQSRSWMWVK